MKSLYVGNLSWDASEEDIRNFFGGVGEINSVTIIKDKETGKSRGFCFVEMTNAEQAIEQFNGADMMGRKLTVNEARPRGDRPDRSSGGYRERPYSDRGSDKGRTRPYGDRGRGRS